MQTFSTFYVILDRFHIFLENTHQNGAT